MLCLPAVRRAETGGRAAAERIAAHVLAASHHLTSQAGRGLLQRLLRAAASALPGPGGSGITGGGSAAGGVSRNWLVGTACSKRALIESGSLLSAISLGVRAELRVPLAKLLLSLEEDCAFASLVPPSAAAAGDVSSTALVPCNAAGAAPRVSGNEAIAGLAAALFLEPERLARQARRAVEGVRRVEYGSLLVPETHEGLRWPASFPLVKALESGSGGRPSLRAEFLAAVRCGSGNGSGGGTALAAGSLDWADVLCSRLASGERADFERLTAAIIAQHESAVPQATGADGMDPDLAEEDADAEWTAADAPAALTLATGAAAGGGGGGSDDFRSERLLAALSAVRSMLSADMETITAGRLAAACRSEPSEALRRVLRAVVPELQQQAIERAAAAGGAVVGSAAFASLSAQLVPFAGSSSSSSSPQQLPRAPSTASWHPLRPQLELWRNAKMLRQLSEVVAAAGPDFLGFDATVAGGGAGVPLSAKDPAQNIASVVERSVAAGCQLLVASLRNESLESAASLEAWQRTAQRRLKGARSLCEAAGAREPPEMAQLLMLNDTVTRLQVLPHGTLAKVLSAALRSASAAVGAESSQRQQHLPQVALWLRAVRDALRDVRRSGGKAAVAAADACLCSVMLRALDCAPTDEHAIRLILETVFGAPPPGAQPSWWAEGERMHGSGGAAGGDGQAAEPNLPLALAGIVKQLLCDPVAVSLGVATPLDAAAVCEGPLGPHGEYAQPGATSLFSLLLGSGGRLSARGARFDATLEAHVASDSPLAAVVVDALCALLAARFAPGGWAAGPPLPDGGGDAGRLLDHPRDPRTDAERKTACLCFWCASLLQQPAAKRIPHGETEK